MPSEPRVRHRIIPQLLAQSAVAARQSVLWSVPSLVVIGICFALMALIHALTGTDVSNFYRDANAIAGQPFYFGALEYASSIMLLMSAAVALFVASTERLASRTARRFLFLFGSLTLFLGLDDLYMVHESMPVLHPRLSELHAFAGYATLLVIILASCYRVILQTPFFLFALAVALLGMAGIQDQLASSFLGVGEDYLELMAFAFWSTYGVATAVFVRGRVGTGRG